MMVPWADMNGRHTTTSHCANGADQKHCRLAVEEMQEITARAFQAYGYPLKSVLQLKYLGQILTAVNENWMAVLDNLRKASTIWEWLSRILGREGENLRVSGMLFKAVV